MSLQSDLERLDTQFRRRQVTMQAGVKLGVSRLFKAIPLEEAVDEGSPAVREWVDRSTDLTVDTSRRLARDSRAFYTSIANLMGAPAPIFEEPEPAEIEAIHTSLAVTGVVGLRKRLGQISPPTAREAEEGSLLERQRSLMDTALQREALQVSADAAGAAAARHAGDGARNEIQDTAQADPATVGWIRITSSRPCYFCAMLASRGPVYKEESFEDSDRLFTGAGRHKVHDSCACSMRPLYSRRKSERPVYNLALEDMWSSLSDELGYSPSITEWRAHYEMKIGVRV